MAYKRASGVSKKGSPEARAKYNATRMRAGKRKCSRCKVVFYRERGTGYVICPRCREHCSRCDVLLTEETKSIRSMKRFICKRCWNELNKNSPGYDNKSVWTRDYNLNRRFGITVNDYEDILKLQKGVCWICQKPPKEGGNRLSVDHLHSRGEKNRNPREIRGRVRGLLCWGCNAAIGKFKDDITKLRRAAEYLEVWPAQEILKEKTNGS